ncbi:uncharacterized protein LOC131167952 [Malania oleifera]|uniref:uncharacterized protein LOC131167952 n=1 Tax=Malania oleifera TaxID=397392 RepID=UPI0025AE3E04|nr:uncharacterized protein LOC131167952 [Malania oleifera]
MADDLDDGEFWLPPEFLTDDDLLMEEKMSGMNFRKNQTEGTGALLPCGFGSFGAPTVLSSPVESVMGSTETESDEEDSLTELTWRMAQSTLQDDCSKMDSVLGSENPKVRVLSGSPQSTLCDVWGGCGCREDSSRGSPNGPSRVSSPPATWELLHAAAGEVARMRMNEEGTGYYDGRGLLIPLRKTTLVSAPVKNPNSNGGLYYDQSLSQPNFHAVQIQQLRQLQMMKQRSQAAWGGQGMAGGLYQQHQVVPNRARANEFANNGNSRPLGLPPSAWPPLQKQNQQQQQQQNGSGMRAVFLDSPGSRKGCAGTGVFLPRRIGNPSETRKKKLACSTVLLPARVVQALNLNLEEMGAQSRLMNGSFPTDTDVPLKLRSNNAHQPQQKHSVRPQPAASHEIRLPQEWTY